MDKYLEALERAAATAKEYLDVQEAFYRRETEEGRELQHWVSPRVKMAREALVRDLAYLEDFGDA